MMQPFISGRWESRPTTSYPSFSSSAARSSEAISVPPTSAVLREAISEGLGPWEDSSRDATRMYESAPTVRIRSRSRISEYCDIWGKCTHPITSTSTRAVSLMTMAPSIRAMERTVAYFFTSRLHPVTRTPVTVPATAATTHFSTVRI